MSNLIPEVRVNKNGVPVTKHVLPQVAGSASKPIPSPVVATPSMIDNWHEAKALVAVRIESATDSPLDALWRLEKLNTKSRNEAVEALLSDDEYLFYMALRAIEFSRESECPYIIGTLHFHRALHLAKFRNTVEAPNSSLMNSTFSSLSQRFSYEFFGKPEGEVTQDRLDYFKADIIDNHFDFRHAYPVNYEKHAALQELVKNMARVEEALPAMVYANSGMSMWRRENSGAGETYLRVPDLLEIARLAEEHPESVEHFYEYARTRGRFDANEFLNMIDTNAPALFEGVL